MQSRYCAAVLCLLSVFAKGQAGKGLAPIENSTHGSGASFAIITTGPLQATTSKPDRALRPSPITGAKVESVTLDPSGQTSTVRIRNLSDKDITAFDLVVQAKSQERRPSISDTSHHLRDILAGLRTGHAEAIHPGVAYDEVLNIAANDVNVDLDVVVYSDATAEFSDREMLMQIIAERKATADAAKQTEEIIRGSSSKAEAITRLTQLWEEARFNHSIMASLLKDHLYNLKNQPGDSDAEQKLHMAEYADKSSKEAEFFSLHANLHRSAQ